jgi:flagellar basal-body rod protein FlgB
MSGIWDITSIGLEKALQATELRQQVLANNVANLSTPGFKRSDVSFASQLQDALDGNDPSQAELVQPTVQTDTASSMRADGNNVNLETEMSDISENEIQNSMLTSLLQKRISDLRYAIREGR